MIYIGINGNSASGKTTLARLLADYLNQQQGEGAAVVISEDAYYLPQDHLTIQEREVLNFDHPDAFDHDLLLQHIADVGQGSTIAVPNYCYETHTRLPSETQVEPCKVLIVEGIHLLTKPAVRELFDYKVYVDTPADICLARRIARDVSERGRTVDGIIQQYMTHVRPMFVEYIDGNKQYADRILNGHQSSSLVLKDLLSEDAFKSLLFKL